MMIVLIVFKSGLYASLVRHENADGLPVVKMDVKSNEFRLSSSDYEEALIRTIPKSGKEAYVIAKAIVSIELITKKIPYIIKRQINALILI